ncbi:MAG: zf-HC2 domain-containing protein [Actinomycetota bacterium]
MRSEADCERTRVDLSARMDGEVTALRSRELDEHLSTCAECRAYEASLRKVKRSLRLQPAPDVPDLTASIVAAVAEQGPRARTWDAWRSRGRTALVAAVIAALVVLGASLPSPNGSDVAVADLAQKVRAAAKEITTYHAVYTITERGWHRSVPVRRMEAEVWFAAPESMRLSVRDHTRYPGPGWPKNDIDLVASETRWWIREPSSCPTPALPGCALRPEVEERALVHRQPFDGTSPVPTDIILPLETIASGEGISIEGRDQVAGRTAVHVVIPYWQAVPLVTSLQPGGSWRAPDPLDRVDLWLEEDTWFPLRFEIHHNGVTAPLLEVNASAFERPEELPVDVFRVPRSGIVRDGGFNGDARVKATLSPSYRSGLREYREGATSGLQGVVSYARGMSWLKVATDGRTSPSFETATGELVRIGDGFGLYQPATELLRRRVDIFGPDVHVYVESNLPRAELLKVASSIDVRGKRIDRLREGTGTTVTRLSRIEAAAHPIALMPTYLPSGYRHSTSLLSESRRGARLITLYRRAEAEFEGFGIRITRAQGTTSLPPSSEDLLNVRIGDIRARWSSERSELEWIDGGSYTAVAVPAFDLEMAVRVADGLR